MIAANSASRCDSEVDKEDFTSSFPSSAVNDSISSNNSEGSCRLRFSTYNLQKDQTQFF